MSDVRLRPAHVRTNLTVRNPHLWQGIEDPYLYKFIVELRKAGDDDFIDRVVQDFGICTMRSSWSNSALWLMKGSAG